MPRISITNNGTSPSGISDDESQLFEDLPAGQTTTIDVDDAQLERLEEQLDELRARVDGNGDPLFSIDVAELSLSGGEGEYGGITALTRWLANRVVGGLAVTDEADTGSAVDSRIFDIAAGSAWVDGQLFELAAANEDETGDAEILVDGTDVSAVDLGTDEDVYTHVLLVKDGSTIEYLFVRGTAAGTGLAEALTVDELATAVGNHLGLSAPYYGFVELAEVLFSEDTGLTVTVTDKRPAPPNYD